MNGNFMKIAFDEAEKAFELGEVPVGAVIVKNDIVISKAFNKKEMVGCALCHAEILAIEEACTKIGNWRLDGCDIYVTLEPCPMCASAIKQSRIKNVFCAVSSINSKNSEIVSQIFSSVDNNPVVCFYNNLDIINGNKMLNAFFSSKREK